MHNWVRPVQEAQWYLTAELTNSFFIGEVDGKRMSSISFVNHGKSIGFASSYYVDKAFRGMGYGKEMIQSVYSDDIVSKYSLYGYSIPSLQEFYNKTLRLKPCWSSRRFKLQIPTLTEKLSAETAPANGHEILPVSQANLEQLMVYSANMVGSSQTSRRLLMAMVSHTLRSSWIAIDGNNEINGFLIMHKTTSFPEGGYLIRPFFADNAPIAQSLLKTAVEYAAQDCDSFISLDVPLLNNECVSLMDELRGESVDDRVFMGSRGVPQRALDKMYGLANLDSI